MREALTSLYRLFDITRGILKEAGVDVSRARKGHQSLGAIAMEILNLRIRPFLVKYHTSLSAYESGILLDRLNENKPVPNNEALAGALVDEAAWNDYSNFYAELETLQKGLRSYVVVLGALVGVEETEDVKPKNDD